MGAWDDLDAKIPMLSEHTSKDKAGYTLAWSIRSWLCSMLRQQGGQQLRRVSDVSVDEFLQTFPDQKSMCQRSLGPRRERRPSLTFVFQGAVYHGPWELCTMVWRLICHPAFNEALARALSSNKGNSESKSRSNRS